jgi:ubiquinone/menaquinone biosynthesis C-methylase UbiE
MEKWFTEDGSLFMQSIGLQKGQYVLDFGCGDGYYTIPAGTVVGYRGKVYAVDNDEGALRKLSKRVRSRGLDNIVLMKCKKDLKVDLPDAYIDLALLYDVLHYIRKRKGLYEEMHRVLKQEGSLSVYPKHCKSDFPMWCLADLEIDELIEEIEAAKFRFEEKIWKKVVHFGGYNLGYILLFRKE